MVQPSKHKSEITKRIDETSVGFSALRLLELNILLIYPCIMINLHCLFTTKLVFLFVRIMFQVSLNKVANASINIYSAGSNLL